MSLDCPDSVYGRRNSYFSCGNDGRRCPATGVASKMKINKLYDGIIDKESMVEIISKKFQINSEEMAYIGDDINDLGLLKKVGLSASPNDGIELIKKECDYICKKNGGEGVFREVADLIINHQKNKR